MKEKQNIIWIYHSSKSWEFGFVDVESTKKWYFTHFSNRGKALDWDEVLAEIKIFKGRQEALVKKILKRKRDVFIGIFQKAKKSKNNDYRFGFVLVKNKKIQTDIFIPEKYFKKAIDWDLVWVKVVSWDDRKSPKWKIIEVFWGAKDKYIDACILESWFREKFGEGVENEVKQIKETIDIKSEIKKSRKDLRGLFTFTIDSPDAKDLDDAISVEKLDDQSYKLYVHIADVSNYVSKNSSLDKIALKRATSVYLADRVLPMLPEKLSNNLCSLNPNTEKLTLTCEMLVLKNWNIKKAEVYESLIKSNFRLTYEEVDKIWEKEKSISSNKIKISKNLNIWDRLFWDWILDKELENNINLAWKIKYIIEKKRTESWTLDFEFPELKIILNKKKEVLWIEKQPGFESNKLIEVFMVSANQSVWKLFSSIPFLYRIHEKPCLDDITILQDSLNLFWINFVFKKYDSKEFSLLLGKIKNHKSKQIIEKVILRSLSKANYSTKNKGHFGLWIDFYSHFTSPIRRYPDLQIHRIIKDKIKNKLSKEALNNYKLILDNVADNCSKQERNAEALEYKARDFYICKFYENKIWEIFDTYISGINARWLFITLENGSEGFINLEDYKKSNNKNNFFYNEKLMQFEDKRKNTFYKIWDPIKVELEKVNFDDLIMYFKILA